MKGQIKWKMTSAFPTLVPFISHVNRLNNLIFVLAFSGNNVIKSFQFHNCVPSTNVFSKCRKPFLYYICSILYKWPLRLIFVQCSAVNGGVYYVHCTSVTKLHPVWFVQNLFGCTAESTFANHLIQVDIIMKILHVNANGRNLDTLE